MKRLFFILAILCSINAFAQVNKVAILDIIDRNHDLEYNTKLMLRSYVSEAVATTKGYETYELTDLGEIIDLYEFYHTGNLSANDIRKIGQVAGIQQLIILEVSQIKSKQLFVTAKLLNATTAQMEKTANLTTKSDIKSIQKGAKDLVSNLLIVVKEEEQVAVVETEPEPEPEPVFIPGYIERISKNEYKIDSNWITRQEYYQFINNHECTPAYQEFQEGLKMEKSGKWTFICGSGVLLVGALVVGIGNPVYEQKASDCIESNNWGAAYYAANAARDNCTIAGFTIAAGGVIAMVTGGTLWGVGIKKKDNAYKEYNENCAPKQTASSVSLNLQSSKNGLGIALRF